MRRITFMLVALLLLSLLAQTAGAAIISAASGKRRVKTSGVVRIVTTTSGQRRIAITIDPWQTMEFQLDVAYPDRLVEPVGFAGFNADLAGGAVTYEGPYTQAGARPPQPLIGGAGPCISNISGGAPPTAAPTNGPTGGSDLFTVWFVDNAPTQDKIFRILGFGEKGIDPNWSRFIEDNYLDILVNDPTDPEDGQVVRILGQDIEGAVIFVPGIGDGTGQVPLPGALGMGLAGAALAMIRGKSRRFKSA